MRNVKIIITIQTQETTVLQVASADLVSRSTLLMIELDLRILRIQLKLVHLFVETEMSMKVKNVTTETITAQLLASAEKDGRSIQVLIDLILLKQILHAAPYVEMVVLTTEKNVISNLDNQTLAAI